MTIEADNLERYRAQIEPIKRWVVIALAVGLFYFAGTSGSTLWSTWLLFKNSTEFGIKDPQFNMDISFFAFRLPFWQTLIAWGISTIVLAIIAAAIVHYLYGGIRLQVQEDRTTITARVQLSVLLGGVVLLKAVAYWFDRYALALKESKLITVLHMPMSIRFYPKQLARLQLSAHCYFLQISFAAHGYCPQLVQLYSLSLQS